jgi:nitroreductase
MNVLEAIAKRRAVRAYKPDAVPEEAIRALLDAAVRAPTAMHAEPWAFAVIQDRKVLTRLSNLAKASWKAPRDGSPAVGAPRSTSERQAASLLSEPQFNVFYDAGTLILICARAGGALAAADCWVAAQNLMLAATDMGLGTCPIGFALPALNRPEVKAELGLPRDVSVVAPIIVGATRGEAPPTSRKAPEIVSWVRAPDPEPDPCVTDLPCWPE